MAEAQKKTVPFPNPPKKEVPVVDMTKPSHLMERVVIPACWLTGGIAIGFVAACLMRRGKKEKEMFVVRGGGL